ncbi:hypothetical protein MHYP_G00159270 [Metynnis hypsauchen]
MWQEDRRRLKSRAKAAVCLVKDDSEESIPSEAQQATSANDDEQLFCVSKTINDPKEPYVQCEAFKDWFHSVCVGYKSIEDIRVISPWYYPECTQKATNWEITCSSENCPLPSLRITSNLLEVSCNDFTALQSSPDSWAEDSQTVCRRKKRLRGDF